MANFPTSLDTLTNPTSGNTLDSPSHSLQHSDANDILEALEAKVGIGLSTAGSATAGHALVASTGGTTTWSSVGTAGLTSGSATNGQVLTADGSSGVSFTTLPTSGLVLLNTTSFSGVASFSLPALTFTSTYNDYLLLINFTAAAGNLNLSMRMRASGTDDSSAAYDRGGVLNPVSTGLSALNAQGGTSWGMGQINSTYPTYSQFAVIFKSPNTTNAFKSAFIDGTYVDSSGTGNAFFSKNIFSGATQFDSASVIASTQNFTGNYSVYGYNK